MGQSEWGESDRVQIMKGLVDCGKEVGFFSNCNGKPLESFKHEYDRLVFTTDWLSYEELDSMRPVRRRLLWAEDVAVPDVV